MERIVGIWMAAHVALCVAVCACGADVVPALDRLALANNLASRNMSAEALKEYESLVGEAGLPAGELDFRLGETYRKLGRTDDARAAYNRVLEKAAATRWAPYARLDVAMLSEGKAREEALKPLDASDVPGLVRQVALFRLGEAAEARGDRAQAIAYYKRSAEAEKKGETRLLAMLKGATLQATSSDAAERKQALAVYLELAFAEDRRYREEALFFAGMLGYREKRYADAAMMFKRLETSYPDSARMKDARLYAAWSNLLSGRHAEAFRMSLALKADNSADREDAFYIEASALKGLGRSEEAIRAYGDLLSAFPHGRFADRAWCEKLYLHAAAKDAEKVLAAFAQRGDPPADEAGHALSCALDAAIQLKDDAKALAFSRRMAGVSDAAYASRGLYLQGVLESRAGQAEAAIATWTKLLALHPDSSYAADALDARALEEIRRKNFKAAGASLEELAKRFPKAGATCSVFYWRGVAARGVGDLRLAEQFFRDALAAHPNLEMQHEIELELAVLLQKRGSEVEASKFFIRLLDTKTSDRLSPGSLAWLSETMLAQSNYPAALQAAGVLEGRKADATWNQIAATLAGYAHQAKGEQDAAASAFRRALDTGARTDAGARAALALGKIESARGRHDAARELLSQAVERSRAENLMPLRMRAYAALGTNEEARGQIDEALRFYMITGTLFDDPVIVPDVLKQAIRLLRQKTRMKEAQDLENELKRRYPAAWQKGGM